MKVEMKQWEIERVKEIVSDILELWHYDFIKAEDETGRAISMSKETFLNDLENRLLTK